MKEVLIKFETEVQASEFVKWFSGYGEQDYYRQRINIDNQEDICNNFQYENNIINCSNK